MVMPPLGGANGGGVVPPILEPSQQPGKVYHIHQSNGPSSVAITPVLTNSNFHSWAHSMQRA